MSGLVASEILWGPRKIAVAGNRGHVWGEQHRIKTRTKRNHWRVNSGPLTISGNYSRSPYDVWHDRAALHFLTDPKDRAAYAERVTKAVRPGGHVIIGTFAPDGPERCSGLPVVRHDARTLGELLGPSFELVESKRHEHKTPGGVIQMPS
jgi:hypothetical protein